MFLPRGKPHACLVTSDELHNIALISPGGFLDAVNKMNAPAELMEVPTDNRSSRLESQKPAADSAPWLRFCIDIGRRNVPGKDIDWRPDRRSFVRRCSHQDSPA
jgi:hypothetical protein